MVSTTENGDLESSSDGGSERRNYKNREWMLLLLGLSGEATDSMMETMKSFLERMRCASS